MNNDRHLIPLVERLDSAVVGCVGDIMLDHFVYGEVSRISPEAPIPVIRVRSQESMLGGLGNVVRNLGALGCRMKLFAAIGEDAPGQEVSSLLRAIPGCEVHLIAEPGRKTPVKVRYIAHGQQLLRADNETTHPISDATLLRMLERFELAIADCSIIVLSDYAKGTLSGRLAAEFIHVARAHGKRVIVDPKGTDFSRYYAATLIKPNLKELGEATGRSVHETPAQETAARELIESTGAEYILVTRGSTGMLLVPRDAPSLEIPAVAREVFEVSGAGDTVAAALAAALGSDAEMMEAVAVANIAAGIVVGKVGTAVADRSEIVREIENQSAWTASDKVLRLNETIERARGWKLMNLRIGLVLGIFDRLSIDGLAELEKARGSCERLVIAVASDSALQQAGSAPAAQDQRSRAYVLASMVFSDAVVICDEKTVGTLASTLSPDVVMNMPDAGWQAAWPDDWKGKVIDLTS
jgi:D-beta-D-heptose 7-phosphate kinase / D-beta-D-heptose 1-phosphate adenosyltransferase